MNELSIMRVPTSRGPGAELTLNMEALYTAVGRLAEVASVNAARAPELLSSFNIAYLNACRYLSAIEYEAQMAERRSDEIRAIIYLDRMPDLLKAAGLATPRSPLGSEDIRLCFLEKDPEWKAVQELIINLRCHVTAFQDMKKAFQNAYDAVKKILGGTDQNQFRSNPNLSLGGISPTTPVGNVDAPRYDSKVTDSNDFFGTPK